MNTKSTEELKKELQEAKQVNMSKLSAEDWEVAWNRIHEIEAELRKRNALLHVFYNGD